MLLSNDMVDCIVSAEEDYGLEDYLIEKGVFASEKSYIYHFVNDYLLPIVLFYKSISGRS